MNIRGIDMELFPAIDIKDGKVVRLTQGDFSRMEVYSSDPTEIAARFKEQGAKNLHIVDLDGAKEGNPVNMPVIKNIVESGGLVVEVGGGIRDESRIQAYLDLGVDRVILGTVIVDDFDFTRRMIERYGKRIAAGIDALDSKVAVRGWLDKTAVDSMELCRTLSDAGVSAIIYTDIAKDGAMSGANIGAYRCLRETVSCEIIASGGISSLDELVLLKGIGVDGAILGKSLYTGAINLKEALEKC